MTRPTYTGLPATWNYGAQITLTITLPVSLNPSTVTVSLMDLGYSTHGVHSAYSGYFVGTMSLISYCLSGYANGQARVHSLCKPEEPDDYWTT